MKKYSIEKRAGICEIVNQDLNSTIHSIEFKFFNSKKCFNLHSAPNFSKKPINLHTFKPKQTN
jgi:hypothetical protein